MKLELLSNYIDVTDSRRQSITHSLTGRLAISVISLSFFDRFECSLRFCYEEFDGEAISDVVYRRPAVIYGKTPKIVKIKHSTFIYWIDLDFLYGFSTWNFIRKQLLMVSWYFSVF